jgi:hypothetical protein
MMNPIMGNATTSQTVLGWCLCILQCGAGDLGTVHDAGKTVHIEKQQMVLNGSMQGHVAATVFGLAGEIEREFISLRTTAASSSCRSQPVRNRSGGNWNV